MLIPSSCLKGPDGCQSGCWTGTSEAAGTAPTSPTASTPASGRLTTGQKTGIIIGAVCFAALLIVLIYFFLRHRKEQQTIQRSHLIPPAAAPSNIHLNLITTNPAQLPNHLRQILQPNDLRLIANGEAIGPLAIAPPTQAHYGPNRGRVYDETVVAAS